jgi:cytochrome c peroxidase
MSGNARWGVVVAIGVVLGAAGCGDDWRLRCGAGTQRVGDACVPVTSLACGAGTHEADGACVADESITVTKTVLGKLLYFDTNLSTPAGQSCASCHAPDSGFADPDHDLPVSRGVIFDRFGNRNSPTAAYMAFSPDFHYDADDGVFVGGQFWDGRAKDLVEQAKGPFLNPLEMNNADEAEVVGKVAASEYAALFERVYGVGALDDVATAYGQIAEAIAAYEKSAEVNRFTSKFDAVMAGKATFTAAEQRGLELFDDPEKGNCAACHVSTGSGSTPALFTDFTYDNLGVPRNPDNPFLKLPAALNPDGADFIDLGLGGVLKDAAENGKFKVPTLRNIAVTAPYMHNGVFATLQEVVEFYNARDLGGFPAPEVAENVNTEELGDLGLTEDEILDLVAFLETLTDGYALATD